MWGGYRYWEVGMICQSAYGGAIEIGVRRQALHKFSSAAKLYANLVDMIPQRRQALYRFSSADKRYTNLSGMMLQRHQALYEISLG